MSQYEVIKMLEDWRDADHEDNIVLSRHQVITLLEALRDREHPDEEMWREHFRKHPVIVNK